MGLYGLDIIIDKDKIPHINELNGVLSGMRGFEQIYGDNRIQEKAYSLLEEKHGKITVNDGTYLYDQYKKTYHLSFILFYLLDRIPIIKKLFNPYEFISDSDKAQLDWQEEKSENAKKIQLPFETYTGQESTVFNLRNQQLSHTINSFICEELTRNKFLQYLLLKDTQIKDSIPPSSLVGLGATDKNELEELLDNHEQFVIKPILGFCGKGVRFLSKDEVAKEFRYSRGPIKSVGLLEMFEAISTKKPNITYLEDLIKKNNFSFEPAVSIIQPFIDSRQTQNKNEKFSVIRAIVVNGKFLDAYKRVSSNPKVNLSQDARAVAFECDDKLKQFCENTIKVFEQVADKLDPKTFKRNLYLRYIDQRGITTILQRRSDSLNPMMDVIFRMMK